MDVLVVPWWLWFCLGLLLFILEVLTPGGFYQVFFGFGAVVTGLLAATGVVTNLAAQGVMFVAVSVVTLLLFRRRLLETFERPVKAKTVDSLVGEAAVALTDIPPDGTGKAELRGSVWNVRNISGDPVSASQRCLVERVDGLTLLVRPEDGGSPNVTGGN